MFEDAKFVSLDKIIPAQHRYSSYNVHAKISKRDGVGYKIEGGNIVHQFDAGQSMYGLNDALPAVEIASGYVLCDGHHACLASLEMRCKTIPIKTIKYTGAPLSKKEFNKTAIEPDDFWLWAEANNYAYLVDIKGKVDYPPKKLTELSDDALRYFASITARRYSSNMKMISDVPGALWIKVGKDIPFIEMMIADRLREHGFEYKYGDELIGMPELVENARWVLMRNPVKGLKLLI